MSIAHPQPGYFRGIPDQVIRGDPPTGLLREIPHRVTSVFGDPRPGYFSVREFPDRLTSVFECQHPGDPPTGVLQGGSPDRATWPRPGYFSVRVPAHETGVGTRAQRPGGIAIPRVERHAAHDQDQLAEEAGPARRTTKPVAYGCAADDPPSLTDGAQTYVLRCDQRRHIAAINTCACRRNQYVSAGQVTLAPPRHASRAVV